MTNYEKIRAMDILEMEECLDNFSDGETDITQWFGKNYCGKCIPEDAKCVETGEKIKVLPCDYGECQVLGKETKLWLESEAEYEGN